MHYFTAQPHEYLEPTMSLSAACAHLGIPKAGVTKLIATGLLPGHLPVSAVDQLSKYTGMLGTNVELPVLRIGGPREVNEPNRKFVGYHVDMSDSDVKAAVLGEWRCDPDRVLASPWLVATVATIPVAVMRLDPDQPVVTAVDESGQERHTFGGYLAGRRRSAGEVTPVEGFDSEIRVILSHRIHVSSGGPLGYLGSN